MPSPRYTIGRNELTETEDAARFGGAYISPPDEPMSVRDLMPAVIASAIGVLVFAAFMVGVGCLTGLACLFVGG